MTLIFRALCEAQPGPRVAGLFHEFWPAYRRWWACEGMTARPTYMECRRALARHMPEMLGLYDQLCELAGGGDNAARFLSFYCPPRYLAGCSQAIWPGDEPLLVRNYDYSPAAFDAVVLKTGWLGRRVMGMSDGVWGLLDGVNDAGLAVSLTFGGRREVGEGFGVPLILRYVLQTCSTVAEACRTLARVPCHMSYNVTALDAARRFATVHLAPDRDAVVTNAPVATNHQERVEWASHARFTATVERERFLLHRLTLHPETQERFIEAFLRPPLYSTAFSSGFGTLYTAAYRPRLGELDIHWPGARWPMSFDAFPDGERRLLAIPA
ncbi:C45 family autoproteolytic acyltransferase/hydolase [Oceanicella actignis]|uniref:C45 family autoproteolytic acyltransferase/hydolase n=1 Tax=Oceanicella actignis TaxID=1189325 RepID=UPI001252C6D0|nr:C45 family peptidase [Oceanicella actignis]TYO90490.1 putative choloylglycine hydrolase [Oceanicella actignis]